MIRYYRKKVFLLLLVLLLFFSFLFIVALVNPNFNLIDIGLPNGVENIIIAVFSFCSIVLVVWDMVRV